MKRWIRSWTGKGTEFLTPEQWFDRGHDLVEGTKDNLGFYWPKVKPGTFVWSPPPAAVSVCLEELRKARMKRQTSTHVVVIPKLMTTLWLKQFYKTMDLVIHIDANNSFWSKKECEPLILGICLPYASHFPWLARNTPKMYQVGREVRRLLPHKELAAVGDFPPCRRMWCGECYISLPEPQFPVMNLTLRRQSEDQAKNDRLINAWKKIYLQSDAFLTGRNGDHLLAPFECDLCIFRKLKERDPLDTLENERLLQACIRRASLDVFWSSATSTVKGNVSQIKKAIKFSQRIGLEGPYIHKGPFPPFDYCRYQVACQMLLNSLEEGKINKSYTQWSTIRKLRTCYANQVRASPQANNVILALNDTKGKYQRFCQDTCGSLWFNKFARGCRNGMGEEWRTNKALSIKLMVKLVKQIEVCIAQAKTPAARHKWMVFSKQNKKQKLND